MFYLLLMTFIFAVKPDWVLGFFITNKLVPVERAAIAYMGAILLRFVEVYLFFDALYMVFIGALKGDGDTCFIMWGTGLIFFLTMALPSTLVSNTSALQFERCHHIKRFIMVIILS